MLLTSSACSGAMLSVPRTTCTGSASRLTLLLAIACPNVVGVAGISDAQLRWLYANCSAVIAASHEDFGLTPVEGYTFGKPAVCLRAGGFLDTMDEGVSGVYIEQLTPESVRSAIGEFRALELDNAEILRHAEAFGFASFKDKLVREVEFALAARGLQPLPEAAERDLNAA